MEGSLYAAMYQRGLAGLKLKFYVRPLLMISGRQSSHQLLGADPTRIFFYCINRDHDSGPSPFSHHKAFIFRLWKLQRTIETFFLNLKCPPITLVTFCSVPTACHSCRSPFSTATESVFAPRMEPMLPTLDLCLDLDGLLSSLPWLLLSQYPREMVTDCPTSQGSDFLFIPPLRVSLIV